MLLLIDFVTAGSVVMRLTVNIINFTDSTVKCKRDVVHTQLSHHFVLGVVFETLQWVTQVDFS